MYITEDLLKQIKEDTFTQEVLDISGQSIKCEDFANLVDAISSNTHVKCVSFSSSDIGDREVELLSRVNLEEIHVNDTRLTNCGAKILLKSPFAKLLSLEANSLSDEAFEEIGENVTLHQLNLSFNAITSEGAKFISKNRTIKTLLLRQNLLNDECTEHFASMESLEKLDLHTNMITEVGTQILYNSHINEINLTQNWNKGRSRIGPERFYIPDDDKMVLVDYNRKRKVQVVESNKAQEESEEKDELEGGPCPKKKNLNLTP
jgi:hypothetical protein